MTSRSELLMAIQAFDLEKYLADRGAERIQPTECALPCPHCGKSNLIVSLDKRAWHCWSCEQVRPDAHGGLLDLLQLLEGMNREQARSMVLFGFHGAIGLERVEDLKLDHGEVVGEAPEILPPAFCQALDHTGILPYCHRRGITPWDAEQFGLMWSTRGRYANRLVFPVWEEGRLVYWQARAMWEQGEHPGPGKYIKSLNPPKTPGDAVSGDVVFNLNVAQRFPSVVITEGPIDAIRVGPDAVCTCGKRLFPAQIGKLLRAGVKQVELMWDGPSTKEPQGAWSEMFTVAEQLKGLFTTRLVFIPRGDPGDYTREQNSWLRQHSSRPVSEAVSLLQEI